MKRYTRSILEELRNIGVADHREHIVESRGSNLIESAVNLLTMIREQYDATAAEDLERKFLIAIKTGDTAKFKRCVDRHRESKP
jgi:hypothetical protein